MSIYKSILLTLIGFVHQISLAQFSNIEIIAGGTFTALTGANVENSERHTGFKIGGLVHAPISYNHYLKIGLVYNQTTLLIDGENTTVNSIVLPVHFKLGLTQNTYVYFGPEAHIYIDQLILEYCTAHNCEWYTDPFKGGISSGDIVLSTGLERSINDQFSFSIGASAGLIRMLKPKSIWAPRAGYYFSTSIGLGVKL